MKWTTDKPTKPGWFWFDNLNDEHDPFPVEIYDHNNDGILYVVFDRYGTTGLLSNAPGARWAGPIEEAK